MNHGFNIISINNTVIIKLYFDKIDLLDEKQEKEKNGY
jgi:hypothetical protein